MKTKTITIVAIFAAILCIVAPISIPIGPVPITLATFAIYLVGAFFDWKNSLLIVFIYILLGALGLPVFSNYIGGLGKLFGPTGGYIIGYLFGAFIQALLLKLTRYKKFMYPISMLVATFVIYLIGTIWFVYSMKQTYTFISALAVCVVPFLIGDFIKIVSASIITIICRERFKNIFESNTDLKENKNEEI